MEKMVSGITTSSYKDSGTSSTGVVSAAYTVSTVNASDTDDDSIAGTLYDNSTGSESSATMSNGDRISISNGNKLYIQVNKDDGWYRIQGSNVNVPGWKYVYTSSTGKGEWAVGDIDTGSGSDSNTVASTCDTEGNDTIDPLITTSVAGLKITSATSGELSEFTATCAGSNPYTQYFTYTLHFRYVVKVSNTTSSSIKNWTVNLDTTQPPFFGYQPLTDDLTKQDMKSTDSTSSGMTLTGTNTSTASGNIGMVTIPANGYTYVVIDIIHDENGMNNNAVKTYTLAHESTTDNILSTNTAGRSSIMITNNSPYQLPVYVESADGNGIFSGTNPVTIKAHDTVATGWVSYTKS